MSLSRRQFMMGAGSLALAQQAGWLNAMAAPLAGNDYRALVCVFLFGGNDGNNTVIPFDTAGYAAYLKARGSQASGGLALAQNTLVPLAGSNLALHPALAPLQSIWQQGKLAVQCNVGSLLRPLSMAEYKNPAIAKPMNLFSHSDQQAQWESAICDQTARSGWAGRIADLQTTGGMPLVTSISGNALFATGLRTAGLAIPSSGSFGLRGLGDPSSRNPSAAGIAQLMAQKQSGSQMAAASQIMQQAMNASNQLRSVLSGNSSVAELFAGLNNPLAQQLMQVARLIEARATLGQTRQIFFVSLGGFDTHNAQLVRQQDLLDQLGKSLKAFYDATVQLGVANSVTTFTESDFGRTLQPAAGGGSDHAWGNHQFVMGGKVKGGIYGSYPSLVLGGPDDVGKEGRWLPTTSIDQYAATLASWFGVSAGDLATVLPGLGAFPVKNLGFMA